eukprot:Gregarina_sp_Pseudo_9__5603@NODE_765_length_2245_cov_25_783772_g720_i0_p3_GENE_NODE_765_length_2245_cov_25_783772_g720_i0NODE_765_length_2245_cov_25_783772_g720_i0_p3_ORF_typecomplete_len277_score93_67HAUS5/PF14817_6/0_0019DUF874/PF05917_11/0_0024Filament/PF00038_21/0_0038CC190/PF15768_5/0_0048Atg14/PF10186_9/0_0049IMD/PF08397_11/0_017Rootletin/PF15035_6/0_018Prominin/PF05478_11/0_034DUF1640/PF07798_11/0_072TBD/PF12845_7/3_2e02TBD/PF12845_7/0_1TBD/PF12845_7/6_8e03FUSC/PF04632_12/0_19Golgin_A5/PF
MWPPPLVVRVHPSSHTRLPRRREYVSLSPPPRPPARTHSQAETETARRDTRRAETETARRAETETARVNDQLQDLQRQQNSLLRRENDLLREELRRLRALLDRRTQHLRSFVASFETFGDALQHGMETLAPEQSALMLSAMIASIQAKSPTAAPETLPRDPPVATEAAGSTGLVRSKPTVLVSPSPADSPSLETVASPSSASCALDLSFHSEPHMSPHKSVEQDTSVRQGSRSLPPTSTASYETKVPKLSLDVVLPSRWLSGDPTAGDTYTELDGD